MKFFFICLFSCNLSLAQDAFFLPVSDIKAMSDKNDVTVIDVREEFEFRPRKEIGIKVINLPLSKLQQNKQAAFWKYLQSQNKKSKLIFICPTGSRAKIAANFARANQYIAFYSRYLASQTTNVSF